MLILGGLFLYVKLQLGSVLLEVYGGSVIVTKSISYERIVFGRKLH